MNQSSYPDYTHLLRQFMQGVGVSSFRQLSRISGISERQLKRLRQGLVLQMRVGELQKLSEALQVPVSQLLTTFSVGEITSHDEGLAALRQEYQRLQQQLEKQREKLEQEFQLSSLQVLESWLLQWPTAAAAAQNNPQLPAQRLLPLVKPVEQLLEKWGVEVIASVGEEVPYHPQWHQLMEGTAEPGESVKVRYVGYRQGNKLLYRAKVSPVAG